MTPFGETRIISIEVHSNIVDTVKVIRFAWQLTIFVRGMGS